MAGTNPAFSAPDFRSAIRAAARMGFPNAPDMIPTFRWDDVRTFAAGHADIAGRPYDFNEAPVTDATIAPLVVQTVVATVEKVVEGVEGTRAGMFRGSKMTLTVLDVDFKIIADHGGGRFADSVLVGDTEYRIEEIPAPTALFSVDVWTIFAYAGSVAKPL